MLKRFVMDTHDQWTFTPFMTVPSNNGVTAEVLNSTTVFGQMYGRSHRFITKLFFRVLFNNYNHMNMDRT